MVTSIELFTEMLRIRRVEEYLVQHYPEQEIRCPMHLCIGQEACAVGVAKALTQQDQVFSGHRAHGHYLAKGGNLNTFFAELYGKSTGCSGGRGGSMHLIDLNAGFLGSTPIVGGTVPIAVGAAWSAKLKGTPRVVVVFFGDGCFEQGVIHESMNFAALHKLPILFVCENNGYSVFTPFRERQAERNITNIALAHGIDATSVNGNNVFEVYANTKKWLKQLREGGGPYFAELVTYRFMEHCGPNRDNHLGYRSDSEISFWEDWCPIKVACNYLFELGILNKVKLNDIDSKIAKEIDEAQMYVRNSPYPEKESLERHLYSGSEI